MARGSGRRKDTILTQIVVGIVVTVVGGLLLAFIVGWLQLPPGPVPPSPSPPTPVVETRVFLDKLSGPAGTVVRTSGQGFAPEESVVIRFHTEQCAETSADASGAFAEVSCTIPKDWPFKGQFDIHATGAASLHGGRAAFRVT